MDDGTGVIGSFNLNHGTTDGVNRRLIKQIVEIKRRKNMFTFTTQESRPHTCVYHGNIAYH